MIPYIVPSAFFYNNPTEVGRGELKMMTKIRARNPVVAYFPMRLPPKYLGAVDVIAPEPELRLTLEEHQSMVRESMPPGMRHLVNNNPNNATMDDARRIVANSTALSMIARENANPTTVDRTIYDVVARGMENKYGVRYMLVTPERARTIPYLKNKESFYHLHITGANPGTWDEKAGIVYFNSEVLTDRAVFMRELGHETGAVIIASKYGGKDNIPQISPGYALTHGVDYVMFPNLAMSPPKNNPKSNPHKVISQIDGGHPQGKPGVVFHLTNVPEGYREAAGCMVQRASDGKVLFLRRSKEETSKHGMYEFPGGKLEEGETVKEAALIETKEEAGLDVKIIRQLNSHVDHTKKKVYHCFLAVPKKGARVTLSFEHDDYKWCSLNKKWSNKKLSHHARYMINQMHDVRSNGFFSRKPKTAVITDNYGTQISQGTITTGSGVDVSVDRDNNVTLTYPESIMLNVKLRGLRTYDNSTLPESSLDKVGHRNQVKFNRDTGILVDIRHEAKMFAGPTFDEIMDSLPEVDDMPQEEMNEMYAKYGIKPTLNNPKGTYHKYTAKVHKILEVEGGAAGLSALKPAFPKKTSKKKAESMLAKMPGVVQHDDGDYILVTGMSNPPVKSKILPIMSGEPSGKHKKLGAVFAEVVIGRNIVKDVGEVVQGIYRGLIGGRTSMAEKRMAMGVASMQKELSDRAQMLGGNAVCNLKIDYEMIQGTATISIIATADAIKMTRPPKNNPRKPLDGMEDKKMRKAKQAYKKFHGGKEPVEMKKETIDVGDVWYALGPCWSIGYKSPKETGEDDQKYIHHTNEDSKDGNYPMMYATMPENGEPMIVIKGGSMKIGMRDGLAWLID